MLRRLQVSARGFTLVELMIVVIFAGVLAVVGVRVLHKQVISSKSIEGVTMVQSIRAAQEAYRAMNTTYMNASLSGAWYPRDPTPVGVGHEKTNFFAAGTGAHADHARWVELKPTVPGPIQFGYQTTAGLSGSALTEPAVDMGSFAWSSNDEPWYVIQAVGDVDADGKFSYFLASSINGEVARIDND